MATHQQQNNATAQQQQQQQAQQKLPLRKQGWNPTSKNYFPTPKALPDYSNRSLPPLPTKPSSSSIYDSDDEGTEQQQQRQLSSSPSHLQIPASLVVGRQDGSIQRPGTADFSGALDESALAMMRPPGIVTDLPEDDDDDGEQKIASLQPRHPDHGLLRLKTSNENNGNGNGDDVSPIMTPPSGKISHQQYDVSPLTPDGGWSRDYDVQVGNIERRRSSHWEDICPPSLSSMAPTPEVLYSRADKTAHRHSDPGSPVDGPRGGPLGFNVAAALNPKSPPPPPPASTSSLTQDTSSNHKTVQQNVSFPQHDKPSSSSASSSKVSFAVRDPNSFSGHRQRSSSKTNGTAAPSRLKLQPEGRAASEHIKTPFPASAATDDSTVSNKSGWDHDEDDNDKPAKKRSSWGSPGKAKGRKSSQDGAPQTGLSKLVSKVTHAGGDVISKISFTSEKTKREKRMEKIRNAIKLQVP